MFFPSLSAASAAARNVCMMHDLSSHVHSSGTLLTANIEEDSPPPQAQIWLQQPFDMPMVTRTQLYA